ncbi:MAG TPA: alpha/beta fold hydrolase [Burkholderiaceae bacterium]|nr:alpha/beta fold hydrolase [Burkholderiaceae bacterium]
MVLMLLAGLMRALSRIAPRAAGRIAVLLTRRTRRRNPDTSLGILADRFRVRGGEVVVHCLGENARPRVLLVHGWNGAAADWRPLAEALVADGFSVCALDLPAHGASPGRVSSLPRFVRGVLEADRRHGPFDVWIAHSMGVAASLAALAGGAQARRLILLGGLVDPAGALREFARGFGLNAAATRAYLAGIEHEERMLLSEVDALRNARAIMAPTLIVHDRDDRVIPVEHGRRLAAALAGAQLLQTSGLGHRRILSDDAIVRSVVVFAKG